MVQTFKLTKNGIKAVKLEEQPNKSEVPLVKGSPVIEPIVIPVAWWKFDKGEKNYVQEHISKTTSEVAGSKTLWRKGVSGTALQFDGYHSEIRLPAAKAPSISGAITVECWVALGAYPWSDVPLIQQLDDVPEELVETIGKRELKEYRFVLKEENDRGYFLGIDGSGKPEFKLRLGDKLQELQVNKVLDRNKWYYLAATYDMNSGLMKVFIDGEKAGQKALEKTIIIQSDKDIRIGKGKDRRPIHPVRMSTFADSYSLDGLIDEIKIYDVSLSEEQVTASYNSFKSNFNSIIQVDKDKRDLPEGENRNEFGAYYTHLKYYDVWDNIWRFGDHPDVVVEFDESPNKFIFWRGTGYIPMMVNDKGQWYSNEFNETWNKSGGKGCQEPMSDKEAYTNHARILENTPARTVVHWRYPLLDVNHVIANYNDTTGWGDWSDWYYYIYPDGIAVKSMRLWTHGDRNHEWQESIGIFGPDQHPEDIINTREALTMLNLKGERATYDWINNPPDDVKDPKGQCIQYINYKGQYKPVTIGDFTGSDVYGGELTEYSVFPAWNHWPAALMPSDGLYARYTDRMACSSLTHVFLSVFKEELSGPTPYYEKLLMEAMLDKDFKDLVTLAKSWMNASRIANLKGATGEFLPGQRAYVLRKIEDDISFSIEANVDSPLVNLAVVVKNWGSSKKAELLLDGESVPNKQGVFRDTDGTKTLTIWIKISENKKIDIKIK